MLYDDSIFECVGPGWRTLLQELLGKIEPLVDDNFEIYQVKEKYGELRFYTNKISSDVEEIIEDYVERSRHTCEYCGAQGELRLTGWWKTLCDSCNDKRNHERESYSRTWIRDAGDDVDH